MTTSVVTTERIHYLDAVRAFALLLGVVFHTSLSFLPIYIGWAVMDVSTSQVVGGFALISHSFRMELFFLIAGFFSCMTLNRKGVGSFIQSRFIRIAIPFMAGWFMIKPLMSASWIIGAESVRGEVNVLNALKLGFQSLQELPTGIFVGSHLWFLYYILLITTLFLALRKVIQLFPESGTVLVRKIDNIVSWIILTPFAWLLLPIMTSFCLWRMQQWGMDTPDKSLAPHWPVLMIYGGFFGLGWIFYKGQDLLQRFSRISIGKVAICLLSIVLSGYLHRYQSNPGHPNIQLYHAAYVFCYAVMMWTLVALTLGLFQRFFDKPGRVVRYIADASYWIYLVHLPIVIWLQIAVAEWEINWAIKWGLVSTVTIAIAVLLYDLLVRPTWVGQVLNGRRKERVLFKMNSRKDAKTQSGEQGAEVATQ